MTNHIKLWGGLGNQLFQYSFSKYLEKNDGKPTKFFTSKLTPIKELDLSYFIKDIEFSSAAELKSAGYFFSARLKERVYRKLLAKLPFLNTKVYIEKSPGFVSKFPASTNVYDGYWQAYQYLDPIENELRSELRFDELSFSNLHFFDDIKKNNSISMHIRRGDYLLKANQQLFAECSLNYYITAVREILAKVVNPVFYVFSNDVNWVREHLLKVFEKEAEFVFVDNSEITKSPVADLFLMSLCKHQIIANSTFSWWGAWLNKNPKKIVIAPKNWYNGDLNKTTEDLIPAEWIRL